MLWFDILLVDFDLPLREARGLSSMGSDSFNPFTTAMFESEKDLFLGSVATGDQGLSLATVCRFGV